MCNSSICDKRLFYFSLSLHRVSTEKQCWETIRGTLLNFNTGIHRTNADHLTNCSGSVCLNTGRTSPYASGVKLRILQDKHPHASERNRDTGGCQQRQNFKQMSNSVSRRSPEDEVGPEDFFLSLADALNQLACLYITSVIHIQHSNIIIHHLSRFKMNLI